MSAEPVVAPLFPSEFQMVERYAYKQELSSNPSTVRLSEPEGEIRIVFPLDGERYASGAAAQRVVDQLQRGRSGSLRVGHLGLSEEGRSNLRSALGELSDCGIQSLLVPSSEFGSDPLEHLSSDQRRLVFSSAYVPKDPRVSPVQLAATLHDEEAAGSAPQRQGFLRCLTLQTRVTISVPRSALLSNDVPRLSEIFIPWPGIPSLENLALRIGEPLTLRFDPDRRGLVWEDVELSRKGEPTDDLATFSTPAMLLEIGQLAELGQESELRLEAKIVFPQCLLSGARLRFFDAAGRGGAPLCFPQCSSEFHLRARLQLGDTFSIRTRRPCLSIRFERVIPDRERLNNVRAALVDLGFSPPAIDAANDPPWQLTAERTIGAHKLQLVLLIGGKNRIAQVQEEQGQRLIRTDRETGELQILIVADFPGDDTTAVYHLNQIHAKLRRRFRGAVAEGLT